MASRMKIQMQVMMTPGPVTCTGNTTVAEALQIMESKKFHHLPIVKPLPDGSKQLIGIVTHRELLHATSIFLGTKAEDKKDKATMGIHLKGFVKKNLYTLPPDAPVKQGLRLMLDKNIGCIPLVEAGNKLVGIVTMTDMLKLLDDFVD